MKIINRTLISGFILAFAFTSCKKKEDEPSPSDESKQSIELPDANFKAALVADLEINTNGDTEISVAEAKAFTGRISVDNLSIADLTGIEEFVNVTRLYCEDNDLTSIDVSKNIALEDLHCDENQLTSIDVSKNSVLEDLQFDDNELTSIDVSNCLFLKELSCDNNELATIDVTLNTALQTLSCKSNKISSLDLSKNSALRSVYCQDNASLSCIKVENNFRVTVWWYKDNTASWSKTCEFLE